MDFPTTTGSALPRLDLTDPSGNRYVHSFVSKLDAAGARLIYSTYLGGTYNDVASAIAVDAAGTAVIAGYTTSTDFPVTRDPLPAGDVSFGQPDWFISRLDALGASLVFSSRFGGDGPDSAYAMALGPGGDLYVTGVTSSDDMPVSPNAVQSALSHGYTADRFQEDAFILRIAFGDLSVSPTSVKVENLTSHAPPATVTLNLNSYGQPRSYAVQASSEASWLSVPTDGATAQSLTLNVSPNGLAPGTHMGSITLTSSGAKIVPSPVPAALIIAELKASAATLDFQPDGDSQILRMTGGSALYFTAQSEAEWLHLDHGAGVTPSLIGVNVDASGLATGIYSGLIRLTPRNAPADAVTVAVSLTVP